MKYPLHQAPRVSQEDVYNAIKSETYTVLPSGRITICELVLDNGFSVIGKSGVCFLENNIPEEGKKIAYKNALNEVWAYLGFRLLEQEMHKG